jgi:hypothetical protein
MDVNKNCKADTDLKQIQMFSSRKIEKWPQILTKGKNFMKKYSNLNREKILKKKRYSLQKLLCKVFQPITGNGCKKL